MAEQLTLNQWVQGSSPWWITFLFKGGLEHSNPDYTYDFYRSIYSSNSAKYSIKYKFSVGRFFPLNALLESIDLY